MLHHVCLMKWAPPYTSRLIWKENKATLEFFVIKIAGNLAQPGACFLASCTKSSDMIVCINCSCNILHCLHDIWNLALMQKHMHRLLYHISQVYNFRKTQQPCNLLRNIFQDCVLYYVLSILQVGQWICPVSHCTILHCTLNPTCSLFISLLACITTMSSDQEHVQAIHSKNLPLFFRASPYTWGPFPCGQ